MVEVVPELKLIIGEQPPVPDLPPQDAQGRCQLVFRRFIGVFARPEHPLALCLDDLQWLDASTALLADDFWERQHRLTFELELHRAECEFLTGDSAAAEERLTMLSSRAVNTVELATVTCLRVDLYTTLDQSDRAFAVCLSYLHQKP